MPHCKSFGYKSLLTQLIGIWKPKGNFSMIDMSHEFFIIKFSHFSDYQKPLGQGQWFVGENSLSLSLLKFSTLTLNPINI